MAPSSADVRKEFSFRTRQSTWDSLKSRVEPLDVLIVGGGIVGAGCLRELALGGLTNALLVEKSDFASGTSSASSKLIHAGIRYLEQAWIRLKEGRVSDALRDFRFVLQASAERGRLRKMAPHLVRSKRIHLVLAAGDTRSPFSVLAGVWFYFLIQLAQGQRAPIPSCYFRRATIALEFPELAADQVRAIFTFSDSETDDARLVLENLQGANDAGTPAMNYVELVGYEVADGRVRATLKNIESGDTVVASARVLINASGAFVDEVAARGGKKPAAPLVDRVAGSHIDIHPPVTDRSFYVTASDGRLVFVLCRNEDGLRFTRIGTTERPLAPGEPSDSPHPTRGELEYLISLTRTFFPKAALSGDHVIGVDSGIRPLRSRGGAASAFQKSREHEIVGDGPVYHLVGVKLTDYRRVAAETVATIRWSKHGIKAPAQAPRAPLRPSSLGSKMYAESKADDIVNFTMPLHWDDIAYRRLGALPRALRKTDPVTLDRLFARVAELFQWSPERASSERSRFSATKPL